MLEASGCVARSSRFYVREAGEMAELDAVIGCGLAEFSDMRQSVRRRVGFRCELELRLGVDWLFAAQLARLRRMAGRLSLDPCAVAGTGDCGPG